MGQSNSSRKYDTRRTYGKSKIEYCNHRCEHNFYCEALNGPFDAPCDGNHHAYDIGVDAIHEWRTGNDCREKFQATVRRKRLHNGKRRNDEQLQPDDLSDRGYF